MAKDNSNSFNNNSSLHSEPGSNKSFVKKVRSRVSGLLPSSLSKWFGNDDNNKATVRQREEDDDDEYCEIQPPSKRAKLPSPTSLHNNFHVNSVSSTIFSTKETNRIHNATVGDRQNNFKTTLLEPIAGPSGVKSRKFTPSVPTHYNSSENLLNGDKDSDSGESTSGYSSMPRISHKNVGNTGDATKADAATPNVNPNNLFNSSAFGGHSRSLFAERSLSPQINSSLSSRRPSFNASTFGSPNFVDRTLSTKRIINSPFYNGRTTYGGASAYGLHRNKSPQIMRESMRKQVQIKPINQAAVSDNAALSKTARRILDTLEQYGTPVSDAKKIPNPSLKKPRHDGLLSKYTGANPYLMREHKASNKELQLPTVPDLLKMKLKERLQDSTVAVRQIATTSKSTLNSDEYKIRTAEDETPKHTNKIKNKVTSVRHKPENETVEAVKLPEVALPITTLPKFDFSLPLPPSCSKPLVTVACGESSKAPETVTKAPEVKEVQPVSSGSATQEKTSPETAEYTFANPLVLAENLVSIIAINDFKFSDPVYKQKMAEATSTKSPMMFNFKSPDVPNKFKPSDISVNFKSSDGSNITLKRKSQSNAELVQPAAQLLFGSVEDMFRKKPKSEPASSLLDKFKPAAGTWECSSCLLRNLPDKLRCAACEAPKDKIETVNATAPVASNPSFGDKFKMSGDKWECGACMVRNASSDTKCVACTTPKPGQAKPNGPIASAPSTFGDKFKPPSSTWECPTCMIRNSNEAALCVACETSNPAQKQNTSTAIGFGDTFKKKSNEWECEECMVRNSSEKVKCLACETPKPGAVLNETDAAKQAAVPKFNFGIFPGATTNTRGFKMEPPQSTKGENTDKTPISAIFGNKPSATTAPEVLSVPTFTFGIPAKAAPEVPATKVKEQPKTELLFKARLPEKALPPAPTGFVFNSSSVKSDKPAAPANKPLPVILPISKPEPKPQPPAVPPVSFNFGSNVSKPPKPDSTRIEPAAPKPTESFTQKPVPSVGGFTFGAATLKRSTTNTDLQAGIGAKRDAPSPASIIFSPPKQPLVANKTDSSLLTKPALPLNGNPNKIEKNMFGSLTSGAAPVPNNSFTFTSAQAKPALPATSANANLFNFAAKTTSVPVFGNTATTEAPVFKFGAPEPPSTQSGFNMQPAASNVFGGNANTSIFGTPNKPVFETPSKLVFEPANKPVFETPNKPVFEAPAPTSAFGTVASTGFGAASSEIKPFSFGAQPSENPSAPKAPAFSFGQTSKPAEPAKAPAFNFGGAAPSNAPSAGGFSFNANPNPAASGGFNFSTPKVDNPSPFQSAAPAPNIFGTPAQVHPQPQQPAQPVQNGGFNFGAPASNNNVKTGFNFGVAAPAPQFNQPPLAPPGVGVFNFGSNPNPAPPAAGGFNFGPSPAAPAFNANMKPTFNFTGGATTTFSAQPTGESAMVAQRKKIRAVRRTQR